MKPTKEQVIAWAEPNHDYKDYGDDQENDNEQVELWVFTEKGMHAAFTLAYEAGRKDEINRIVNLLMIQHEAAKDRHNYWLAAARLVQGESA